MHVHLADGDDALIHIGSLFRVRLGQKPFVALPGGSGFVGVDPGDDDQLLLYFLLNRNQTAGVVADRVFIVSGAGADDHQKFIALAGKYLSDLFIPLFF